MGKLKLINIIGNFEEDKRKESRKTCENYENSENIFCKI